MAERAASNAAIQKLLDERQQIDGWLARLNGAGQKAPSHVRDRVRHDYEERRAELIRELQGHAETVRESLADREDTRRRMSDVARELEDRLAEAELRHDVGEYADGEWEKIQTDSGSELSAVRARLSAVQEEIDRLSEVVRLIESGEAPRAPVAENAPAARPVAQSQPAPAPQPAPEAKPAPEPKPVQASQPASEWKPAVEPKPAAEPQAAEGDGRPFDELAFLKSVTEGSEMPPTRRSSGEHRTPVSSEGNASDQPPASPFRRASTEQAQKTLRCAECGTMNLPTEWYCEQCGAELAAL